VPPSHPPPRRPIRVLIVDDSTSAQETVRGILAQDPAIEVAGCASDGEEALRLALKAEPDCVCLDLEMPRMDGFTFLRMLMAKRPTPVVVISSRDGKQDVFRALELGALDFVRKARSDEPGERERLREELIAKVGTVRALRLNGLGDSTSGAPAAAAERAAPRQARRPDRIVAIGASTGGPNALTKLLSGMPDDLSLGYAVAQHMSGSFTRAFAERLARRTGFDVREAEPGDLLTAGRVLVAPGGKHLRLSAPSSDGPLQAELTSPAEGEKPGYCPSIDQLFASAAACMGPRVCAVVLTGMGDDGQAGVRAVKEAGGLTLAESEESAVVNGMPGSAAATGSVDEVLSLESIQARICRFAEEP
jgi:two-component system chemotaxis response regulator CheB